MEFNLLLIYDLWNLSCYNKYNKDNYVSVKEQNQAFSFDFHKEKSIK